MGIKFKDDIITDENWLNSLTIEQIKNMSFEWIFLVVDGKLKMAIKCKKDTYSYT